MGVNRYNVRIVRTRLSCPHARVAVASSYTDPGATAELQGPPDENYDHANFYWRLEEQPEAAVQTSTSTTVGNSGLGMLTNEFVGDLVRITRGKGATQERAVIANTSTTLTVAPAWTVTPDTTSFFVVADSTWNFGGLGATSPVTIEVPNQTGATVEISGRSANALNQESAVQLNPLTRWQIGGRVGRRRGCGCTGGSGFRIFHMAGQLRAQNHSVARY